MELDLKELLLILWERALIIILSVLGFGVVFFLVSYFIITPIYSASASMYVYNVDSRSSTSITQGDLTTSQKLVDTYIVILKSDAVLKEVIERLDVEYTPKELLKMLTASSINNTEAFSITINHPDPEQGQKIVNTIAMVAPAEILRVVKAGAVEVIDYATLPEKPSSPNVRLNTLVGLLLGLVLSIGGILMFEMFNTTINTEKDLTDVFNIPVIGAIPTLISETQKK